MTLEYCTVQIENYRNSTEETKDPNHQAIIEALECLICQVLMSAPIYNCVTGHAICNGCKKKLTECPLCKQQLTDSRNFALENIAISAQFFCSHRKQGCMFVGNVEQWLDHEKICTARPNR